jgi:hypothetical protein
LDEAEDSASDDDLCDVTELNDGEDECDVSELAQKVSQRFSIESSRERNSALFGHNDNQLQRDLRARSLSFQQCLSAANLAMIITPDKVISISGINMVKQIIMKHIELMAVCQSHSFEIFVSLSNLVRFYTYIVTNVFVGRKLYNLLT